MLWPGDEAIGKCLFIGEADDPPCNEVVGVVEDSRRQELIEGATMQYYVPVGQALLEFELESLFIRADPAAHAALIEAARREIQAISDAVRFVRVRPYRDYIDPQARSWELGATMFTVLGTLALVIAAVGLYGVLSFNVVQQRPRARRADGAGRGTGSAREHGSRPGDAPRGDRCGPRPPDRARNRGVHRSVALQRLIARPVRFGSRYADADAGWRLGRRHPGVARHPRRSECCLPGGVGAGGHGLA